MKKYLTAILLLCVAAATGVETDAPKKPASKAQKHRANIDAFFSPAGPVASLSFEFAPEELAKIRKDPREYAEATMTEAGGKTYRGVGVKLKGGRSFREIDAKPGLTVNMKKYPGGERFHGMEKFHLNNAVQDATYLHEIIAAEVCRGAGVPTGRGTHAVVSDRPRFKAVAVGGEQDEHGVKAKLPGKRDEATPHFAKICSTTRCCCSLRNIA